MSLLSPSERDRVVLDIMYFKEVNMYWRTFVCVKKLYIYVTTTLPIKDSFVVTVLNYGARLIIEIKYTNHLAFIC